MKKYNRLSQYKIKKIAECFCIDIDATKVSHLLKLNRKIINSYYMEFRKRFAKTASRNEKVNGGLLK